MVGDWRWTSSPLAMPAYERRRTYGFAPQTLEQAPPDVLVDTPPTWRKP